MMGVFTDVVKRYRPDMSDQGIGELSWEILCLCEHLLQSSKLNLSIGQFMLPDMHEQVQRQFQKYVKRLQEQDNKATKATRASPANATGKKRKVATPHGPNGCPQSKAWYNTHVKMFEKLGIDWIEPGPDMWVPARYIGNVWYQCLSLRYKHVLVAIETAMPLSDDDDTESVVDLSARHVRIM